MGFFLGPLCLCQPILQVRVHLFHLFTDHSGPILVPLAYVIEGQKFVFILIFFRLRALSDRSELGFFIEILYWFMNNFMRWLECVSLLLKFFIPLQLFTIDRAGIGKVHFFSCANERRILIKWVDTLVMINSRTIVKKNELPFANN